MPEISIENIAPEVEENKAGGEPTPKKCKLVESVVVEENKIEILSTTTSTMNTVPALRFVRMSPQAKAPVYGSALAAGADLCAAEECIVSAKGKYLVSTGLQVAIPTGYYGRVAPRSGLASKHFIDVGAGVVDEDYRGELKVLLFNFSATEEFKVNVGDRIAQLICEKYLHADLQEVDSLEETVRGANGFGSTGLQNIIPPQEMQQ